MTNKDIYCKLPFEGYCVRPSGKHAPCYGISNNIELEHHELIDDYFNSPLIKYMQQEMASERIPMKTCHECVEKEAQGVESQRERWELSRTLAGPNIPFFPEKLRYLDISFSNTCNMSCIMCSNQFSSSWNKITKQMPRDILDIVDMPREFTHSISYEEIDSILNRSSHLISMAIKGGEPLYDKRCLYFLERLADINPEVQLKIISNISVIREDILSVLRKFPNLTLHASVDGIGKTYEYVRGYSYEKIEENFDSLLRYDIPAEIMFCVSAYNLRVLQETHNRFMELGSKSVVVIVANNPYLHFRHLGQDIVEPLLQELDLVQPLRAGKFSYPTPAEEEQFKKYTAFMNKIRGFNWEDIYQ